MQTQRDDEEEEKSAEPCSPEGEVTAQSKRQAPSEAKRQKHTTAGEELIAANHCVFGLHVERADKHATGEEENDAFEQEKEKEKACAYRDAAFNDEAVRPRLPCGKTDEQRKQHDEAPTGGEGITHEYQAEDVAIDDVGFAGAEIVGIAE